MMRGNFANEEDLKKSDEKVIDGAALKNIKMILWKSDSVGKKINHIIF